MDEIKTERDNLAKKANTAERYKQKLQANQALQKQNEELREELDEVRQQLASSEKGRQQVAGLQLAMEEYKRILPKIEREHHELQMMKKQLEFDNATLAQRWDTAKEQQARDQESIANLTDRLADLENSRSPTLVESRSLSSELEESTRKETLLQVTFPLLKWMQLIGLSRKAKVHELETQNQQLKGAASEQDSRIAMLQELLDDAKERQEEREEKHLEVYQEKLLLESSLASLQQGDSIQGYARLSQDSRKFPNVLSTEIFEKMRKQVNAEHMKRIEAESELSSVKSQLQAAESDGMSSKYLYRTMIDEYSNLLSVQIMDPNDMPSLEEVKQRLSSTLTELQSENKNVKRQTRNILLDLEQHKTLLKNAMDEKNAKQDSENSDLELKAILQDIKAATTERPLQAFENTDAGLNKQIDTWADKLVSSRERLAKSEEVQASIFSQELELQIPQPRFTRRSNLFHTRSRDVAGVSSTNRNRC